MSKFKITLIRILVGLVAFIIVFILNLLGLLNEYVVLAISILIYLIVGYDIVYKCITKIFRGNFLDENFLMTVATVGAFAIGEYLEAVAVMLFYQIGELFQNYAVNKSRKSIANLMDIRPDKATKLVDDKEVEVAPEDVAIDDLLIVKVGEKIPLDGVVIRGNTSLDTKALTGESIPVDVSAGDSILSGSINIGSSFIMKVTKEYYDSTVSKILDLVENVGGKKAKAEAFITKFARYYTPIVVGLALLLGIIPPIFDNQWSQWIFRALTFLVVSCPCALVISVPLSFFCGIGAASKNGILIKGGSYLEMLNKANIFIFDKTGTLTKGDFEVTEVLSDKYSDDEVLKIAAIAEKNSNHPIAKSILKKVNANINSTYEAMELPGYGLVVQEENILVGNQKLMEKYNIKFKPNHGVGTVVYVAKNNEFMGSILISDQIKETTYKAISDLNSLGCNTIMLTGDNDLVAKNVKDKLNIKECYSQLLPQNKVEKLENIIKNKNKNDVVAFVGDGINDAPSLMRADIGISMGAIGSDSAIEASDVVLMYDDLNGLLVSKKIAKKTIAIVLENIVFAIFVKVLVLLLSAIGLANMWLAIVADVGVCVIAVLNAMRCIIYKDKSLKNKK